MLWYHVCGRKLQDTEAQRVVFANEVFNHFRQNKETENVHHLHAL